MKQEPSAKLYPYECPSCGGHLETDETRKLMICRSCGRSFDYDYFCEENLIRAADKALADGSFSAAGDMYSFMLDKEPSNVKALKGLILAANKVTRLYDITMKIRNGTFVPGTFNLRKYRDRCDTKDTGFFGYTDKILELYKEYTGLEKTMKDLKAEEEECKEEIGEYTGGLFYYESAAKLKTGMITSVVVLTILVILTVMFSSEPGAPALIISVLVLAMIITGMIILSLLLEMYSNKKEKKNPAPAKLDAIDAKIEDTGNEMNRIIRQINDVFKEMNSV